MGGFKVICTSELYSREENKPAAGGNFLEVFKCFTLRKCIFSEGIRVFQRSKSSKFSSLRRASSQLRRFARNAFPLKELDLSTQILRFQRRRRRGTPKSVSVADALSCGDDGQNSVHFGSRNGPDNSKHFRDLLC